MSSEEAIDLNKLSLLLPKAKVGDEVARNEVCKQIQDYLNLMAEKQLDQGLKRKVNPSDIVQQTMTRMINGFEEFRGASSAEFYGWLNRILENEVKSTRRNFQREKRDYRKEHGLLTKSGIILNSPESEGEMTPAKAAMQAEKIDTFHRVLKNLPEDYATVIQLRSLEELSFKEVGERMGKSYDAATKLWYRAIVKLQDELEKLDDSMS